MKQIVIIALLVLSMLSCKKEAIPELGVTPTSSDLFITGTLGTESININSSGNYYMYSNYIFDSVRQIYVFQGELKESFCTTDCGIGITLKLNNYKRSPGGVVNFDKDSILETRTINWYDTMATFDYLSKAELIIDYNDTRGIVSSFNEFQDSNKSLVIKSVDMYQRNELGQPTVKIQFDGKVMVPSVPSPKLFTFSGSFAVAYPE